MGLWDTLEDVALELGYAYLKGKSDDMEILDEGVRQAKNGNYNEAFKCFQVAAEHGLSTAMYNLAICYKYGQGTNVDYENAAYWFRKAAEKGESGAKEEIDNLGNDTDCLIQKGELNFCRKDFYTKFSLSNVSYSWNGNNNIDRKVTIKIGRLQNESAHHSGSVKFYFEFYKTQYSEGNRNTDGFIMAERIYSKSGCRGNCYGWNDIEFVMDMNGNPPTGDYYPVLIVSELNEDESWYTVGYCNFDNRQHWHHEEDSLGDMISLADKHMNNGEYEEGAKLFLEAAEQGNAYAQFAIGICYRYGDGVQQDSRQAFEWFEKAAEQGNANAQHSLGVCYRDGEGVQQDYRQALEWFEKYAEQGNADAQKDIDRITAILNGGM